MSAVRARESQNFNRDATGRNGCQWETYQAASRDARCEHRRGDILYVPVKSMVSRIVEVHAHYSHISRVVLPTEDSESSGAAQVCHLFQVLGMSSLIIATDPGVWMTVMSPKSVEDCAPGSRDLHHFSAQISVIWLRKINTTGSRTQRDPHRDCVIRISR